MRWPWSAERTNRGTLTFMADGQVILGVPAGTTDEERYRLSARVRVWTENEDLSRKVLILPWPVDVIDKRVR